MEQIEIISFYQFKDMRSLGDLESVKPSLKGAMADLNVRGTILLAEEGFNGMVCGSPDDLAKFVSASESILDTKLELKSAFNDKAPFRKLDVRIKPEIVTLRKTVNVSLGEGTHVEPKRWNELISGPDTILLDTRNLYEYKTGTFVGAINPNISKFSELPKFVAENLDPSKHKRVAMFCTGGIRCEKFAPYLKEQGFEEVFQLKGGILNYLKKVDQTDSLWQGECFVFDERVSVNNSLEKGEVDDLSQRHAAAKGSRASEAS